MTDSKNSGGRLYRSARAKHPDAAPAPRGRRAVNPDRFDFLETTDPARVADVDVQLPGARGLRGWQLFLLIAIPTAAASFTETTLLSRIGYITAGVFVVITILGSLKTRAESSYATWTSPVLAYAFVALLGSLTKYSSDGGLLTNLGTIAVEFFTRLSAMVWPVIGATVVGWIIGRRTLVAYRAARYRLQRKSVRGE